MFRRILSSLICAAVAFSPMTPAAAQGYIYRYKQPVAYTPPAKGGDDIGLGNDIVAYYTAPVGHEFVKRIPVKTQDVETWVVDEGDMPSGIALDRSKGVHTGEPDVEQKVMHRLSGYDSANNRIAKAEVHFDIREPIGIAIPVRFLAHKGQYSYNVIPSPDGVDVERWDQWNPMPDGMSQRNEALEGYPSDVGEHPLLWQGYDDLNRPVAYAHGDLVVTEGPRIDDIVGYATNPARSQSFNIQAVSHDVIGTAVYRLVLLDGYRPEGLEFDAETGLLTGAVADFGWRATFKIVVTDTYDGTTAETLPFELSTVDAMFDMDEPKDIVAYRGENYSYGFDVKTTIPGLTWTLATGSGPLPPQMFIDPEDRFGFIRGAPTEVGEWPGIILVASAPGFEKRVGPFSIKVEERVFQVRIPYYDTRVGYDIETKGVTITRGRADPVVFRFTDPASVPAGMSIDPDTGVIKLAGGHRTVGSYPVAITIKNGDGKEHQFVQQIMVHPDLAIAYEPGVFTRYQSFDRLLPDIDRTKIVGTATYTIAPDLPSGLAIGLRNGIIQPVWREAVPKTAIGSQQYVVTMTDGTGIPIPTDPFTIEVKDRPDLVLSEDVLEIERYTGYSNYNRVFPVSAEHAYPSGSARYSYTGILPEGLEISEYGYFRGSTKDDIGDYPGISVTVTDDDGQSQPYGPFTVKLKQAKPLQDLVGQSKPETWVAGQNFDFQLPGPANGRKPFKWVLTDAPAGLTVSDDGVLSGTIPLEGVYTIRFDVSDDTARDPAEGTLELTLEEPFEFVPVAQWDVYKNLRLEYPEGEIKVERGIKPFIWTVDPSTPLPNGGLHSSGGWLYGTPTLSTGGFPLKVWMKDKTGVNKSFSTFVNFNPPKPLSVSYPEKTLLVGSTANLPFAPKLNDKTVKIASWSITGQLPSGVSFDTLTGEFKASPYPAENAAGIHVVNVSPHPVDPDVTMASPGSFPVTLKIGYSGEIGFGSKTFKHRVNADISQKLSYSKAVEPVKFSAVSFGDGVSFDPATATFTAKYAEPGTYTAGSVKIEENDDPAFDREKVAGFAFEIVPEVALTVPWTMAFGQFDEKSVGITEVLNVIGDGDDTTPDVTYGPADGPAALPQGLTVNALTGAVEGVPEIFGEFGPFAITAFDAYGDKRDSNEFSITVAERQQLAVSYLQGFSHFRRYGTHTSGPTPENGYGPYTWSIDRTPPSGISFDDTTGTFRASSDAIIEPQTFTVTVVDSKGGPKGTATVDVTVGVAERPQLAVKYDSPVTFTRHVADLGKEPSKSGTVQRGGALEFSLSPVAGGDDLASCISFDEATGRLAADPACTSEVPAGDYVVTVTDATWRNDGNAYGKTEVTVRVGVQARPAITLDYPDFDKAEGTFGFQRHNARTVTPQWNNPLGTDVTWSISPTPPAGITFNHDGSITVDSADLIAAAPYVVTVEDEFDGETPFPMVLGVAERKQLEFSLDPSVVQPIELNGDYELTLEVKHAIVDNNDSTADVFYTLVSGTLPKDIQFDAVGTDGRAPGTFHGTPDVADHNKSFPLVIRATDAFNGEVQKTFTLKVVEDATPMKLTYAAPSKARVGYAWSLAAPTVEFAVGNFSFSAPDLAAYGLSIDAKTGEISGRPNTTFDMTFDVTVTDNLGADRAVTVQVPVVSVQSPTVTVPNPVSILYNRDISEEQQREVEGVEDPGVWTLDPASPPPGITFDPASGLFGGQAEEIGLYGPYTLTLDDALPGAFPSVFSFDIAMNDDPIELEELSVLTKVGFPFETKAPQYDNHYKVARFSGPQLEEFGLSVDPVTGVVSGRINEPLDQKPNLVVRDDRTIRTTSMPVNIKVLPRLRLTAPETIFMTAFEVVNPRPSVTPAFQAGTVTWEDIDPQFLPNGVIYDTDGTKGCGKAATFCGTPLKAETLGPFKLAATDTLANGLTDRAESNEITIVVQKGVFAMEFLPDFLPEDIPGLLPEGTKRTAYSHDLVAAGMFEWEGVDLSTINFSLYADPEKGEAVPPGLTMKKNGILSGIPEDEGTYTFDIVAKYSTKPSVSGKFTITTKRPDTVFTLESHTFADAEKGTGITHDFKTLLTHTNIPADKVTWTIEALANDDDPPVVKSLPNITLSAQGVLAGTPEFSGNFTFKIKADFTDRKENYQTEMVFKLVIKRKEYKFKQIEVSQAGDNPFTCGIDLEDDVYCWGANDAGQLGQPYALTSSGDPKKVDSLTEKAKAISLGADFACVITATDRVACWGRLIATVNYANTFQPYYVGNYRAKSIDAGYSAACMVTTGDDTVCLGRETWRRVNNAYTPQGGLPGNTAQVSVGWRHICAVTKAGGAKCWGAASSNGQEPWLGIDPDPTSDVSTPRDVTVVTSDIAKIVAGDNYTCIHMTNGQVKCFGQRGSPPVGATVSVEDIDINSYKFGSNDNRICVKKSSDTLRCGNADAVFPAAIQRLSVGTLHVCAVVAGGDAYCIGQAGAVAMGAGSQPTSWTSPTLVTGQ